MPSKPKSYNLESPVAVFRTVREHWEFYTGGSIVIRRISYPPSGGGQLVPIPGKSKVVLTKEELSKRPDILTTLIKVLESWRP